MNIHSNLTGFQRDLLRTIAHNDGSRGLLLKDELEELYGQSVNHGRLYPNLDQLVDAGLLEKGTIDKRTNSYSLTDEGYETVERFHSEWQSADVAMTTTDAASD